MSKLLKTVIAAALMSSPAFAAPDLDQYRIPPIELPPVAYSLTLKNPVYAVKTLDGKKQIASLTFQSGKTSSLVVDFPRGRVEILNRANTTEPYEAISGDGYIEVRVAPLTNAKGKKHRLTCVITNAKKPIGFALQAFKNTTETVSPENGYYYYEFDTLAANTVVNVKPGADSYVYFYGCKVSLAT